MIHVTIQQISSYLDEQLAETSTDLVRQHLDACPECEAKLRALARMDAALTKALSHEPDEGLFQRLEREIASALGPDPTERAREILAEESAKPTAPAPAPPRAQTSTVAAAGSPVMAAAPGRSSATPPARGSTPPRPSAAREVPATAWMPSATRGTAARIPEPPRTKGSSAGTWVAILSLAVIAGSAGVVVSHTGAVQGWLDSLVGSPNFTVPRPGADSTGAEPVAPVAAATDSTAMTEVTASLEGEPGAPGSQASGSTLPAPPGAPRSSRAGSRPGSSELEPVEEWEDSEGDDFEAEESSPQTMRADEVMASSGASAGSARGPGGTPRDDPYANLRPESQAAVREAERVHQQTLFHPTAEQFDVAAIRWERALEGLSGPEQVTVRGRLADARYRAWEAGPTPERADAATSAIRSYLLFAPPGIAREEAKARLERLDAR